MLNDVRHPEAPPFSFVLRAVPLLNNIQPGCYSGETVTKEFSRTSSPLTPSLSSPDRDGAVQKCLCRPIWWPALGGHTGQGEQGKGSTSRGHWQQLTSLLPGSNQPTHRPVHSTALQKEKLSKSTWSSLSASFNLCIFLGERQNVYFCICNIEIVYISLWNRAYWSFCLGC